MNRDEEGRTERKAGQAGKRLNKLKSTENRKTKKRIKDGNASKQELEEHAKQGQEGAQQQLNSWLVPRYQSAWEKLKTGTDYQMTHKLRVKQLYA